RFNFQTAKKIRARSLAAPRARALRHFPPSLSAEGTGKAGCRLHPWLPCNKKHGSGTTGSTGNTPAFPAQWFTTYFVLSSVTGLFCHRRRRDAEHHRQLSASVGAPGPHDFAVRVGHVRLSWPSRPPHLTARS